MYLNIWKKSSSLILIFFKLQAQEEDVRNSYREINFNPSLSHE